MFEQLKSLISRYVSLSQEEWDQTLPFFTPITVARRTKLVPIDKVATELYFISRGAIRNYYLHDVEEICSSFSFESSFTTSFGSFINRTPSQQVVETMEDCELLSIDRSDYDRLHLQVLKINISSRIIMQQYLLRNDMHLSSLIHDDPQLRYRKMMKKQPQLIKRVPQQYIASYLDIPLLHLSRIIESDQNKTEQNDNNFPLAL